MQIKRALLAFCGAGCAQSHWRKVRLLRRYGGAAPEIKRAIESWSAWFSSSWNRPSVLADAALRTRKHALLIHVAENGVSPGKTPIFA